MAEHTRTGFARFWNEATGYCYDAIDSPSGDDLAMRPNQLFAASLPYSPLTERQRRAVVDACTCYLLTSHEESEVVAVGRTRSEWSQKIDQMIVFGAKLTEEERETLVEYLAETYGP